MGSFLTNIDSEIINYILLIIAVPIALKKLIGDKVIEDLFFYKERRKKEIESKFLLLEKVKKHLDDEEVLHIERDLKFESICLLNRLNPKYFKRKRYEALKEIYNRVPKLRLKYSFSEFLGEALDFKEGEVPYFNRLNDQISFFYYLFVFIASILVLSVYFFDFKTEPKVLILIPVALFVAYLGGKSNRKRKLKLDFNNLIKSAYAKSKID